MHSFEVHSNESACRKSGRLGLEQIIKHTNYQQYIEEKMLYQESRKKINKKTSNYYY